MKIWVDADACPVAIRAILYRASERTQVPLILVANQRISFPSIPSIQFVQVARGFDIADNEIIKRAVPGDLVITSDIPLAAEVIEKGAYALSPRGEYYSTDNIKSRLQMRDFMETLRSSGIHQGGPPSLHQRDRQAFANRLQSFLSASYRKD